MGLIQNAQIVTVIVPAYNHEKYIIECLESIHQQTFRNFQWIVVDDGSKDSTPQILQANKNKYGYELILQKNKGLSQTLTDVLKDYAVGKYVCICASDDFWCVDKLEKQLRFMEANPEYAMCYGRTYNIDINSNILGVENYTKYKGGMIFEEIIMQKFHPPVNYMIRRDVLRELGYYKGGVIAEDFYMNCLIAYKYPIGYIPEILGYYRIAELQKKRDPYLLYKSHEDTINLFKKEAVYSKAYSLHCLRCFMMLSVYKRYKLLSLKYFFKSFKSFKSLKNIFAMDALRGYFHLISYWQ